MKAGRPRRRFVRRTLLLCTTACLTLGQASRPAAPPIPRPDMPPESVERVSRVVSGSTLVVRDGPDSTVVRLIGLEVPKADAESAEEILRRVLEGEGVLLEHDERLPERDDGGRRWAYVYRSPDGLFVNLEMVREGAARIAAGDFAQRELFLAYEARARAAKKGIWAERPAARPAHSEPREKEKPGAGERDAEALKVYITRSGTKYHRASCRYARENATEISLAEARRRGLEPCRTCHPDSETGDEAP